MNFTKNDYVASSRRARKFLQQNDFYIYEEDEMILTQPLDIPWQQIMEMLKWFFIVGIIAGTVTVVLVVVFVYVRKTGKRGLKEVS